MNYVVILIVALLQAVFLWLYIWKKDTQKEPTSWLLKAVLWGVALIIPVAILESGIETFLFGVVIGGLSFFVLIYFCVKMHKVAQAKVLSLVEKDNDRIKV